MGEGVTVKNWPHSGFNVFIGEPISPNDTERLLFAARYLKKCPLSNERLRIIETNADAIIEYATYKNGEKSIRSFTPLEFLAELQQHIPDIRLRQRLRRDRPGSRLRVF